MRRAIARAPVVIAHPRIDAAVRPRSRPACRPAAGRSARRCCPLQYLHPQLAEQRDRARFTAPVPRGAGPGHRQAGLDADADLAAVAPLARAHARGQPRERVGRQHASTAASSIQRWRHMRPSFWRAVATAFTRSSRRRRRAEIAAATRAEATASPPLRPPPPLQPATPAAASSHRRRPRCSSSATAEARGGPRPARPRSATMPASTAITRAGGEEERDHADARPPTYHLSPGVLPRMARTIGAPMKTPTTERSPRFSSRSPGCCYRRRRARGFGQRLAVDQSRSAGRPRRQPPAVAGDSAASSPRRRCAPPRDPEHRALERLGGGDARLASSVLGERSQQAVAARPCGRFFQSIAWRCAA